MLLKVLKIPYKRSFSKFCKSSFLIFCATKCTQNENRNLSLLGCKFLVAVYHHGKIEFLILFPPIQHDIFEGKKNILFCKNWRIDVNILILGQKNCFTIRKKNLPTQIHGIYIQHITVQYIACAGCSQSWHVTFNCTESAESAECRLNPLQWLCGNSIAWLDCRHCFLEILSAEHSPSAAQLSIWNLFWWSRIPQLHTGVTFWSGYSRVHLQQKLEQEELEVVLIVHRASTWIDIQSTLTDSMILYTQSTLNTHILQRGFSPFLFTCVRWPFCALLLGDGVWPFVLSALGALYRGVSW